MKTAAVKQAHYLTKSRNKTESAFDQKYVRDSGHVFYNSSWLEKYCPEVQNWEKVKVSLKIKFVQLICYLTVKVEEAGRN